MVSIANAVTHYSFKTEIFGIAALPRLEFDGAGAILVTSVIVFCFHVQHLIFLRGI